jgi:hypothetical protein
MTSYTRTARAEDDLMPNTSRPPIGRRFPERLAPSVALLRGMLAGEHGHLPLQTDVATVIDQ